MNRASVRPVRHAASSALLVIALAGAAGCGSSGGDADTDPASVLPAGSAAYFELTVRPEGKLRTDLEAVAKKVLRKSDPGGEIVKAVDKALAGSRRKGEEGATFAQDIEPWLGKRVGVAITSLRNLNEPDFAVAIASTDNDKALESLNRRYTTERKYKDVAYLQDNTDQTVAGVVGDTVVIGTVGAFKDSVDAQTGDQQLDDSKGLAAARKNVDRDSAIGFVYFDLAKTLATVTASQPLIASQLGPLTDLLGKATSIGAAISVTDDAIRIDTVQVGGPAGRPRGDAAKTLAALPSATIAGVGLGDIGATLGQVVDQITSAGPIAGQDPKQLLGGLESQLGLSLQRDVLSWMGEGALFVQGTSVPRLGGGIVVRSKSPATTARTLRKLVPLLRGFGAPVVDRAPEGADAGFRIALGPAGGYELLAGLKADRFVIGVGTRAVRAALAGPGSEHLGDTPAFTAAAAKLGDGISPSLYVDVPAVVALIEQAAGSSREFEKVKPYLQAFTAIVAGGKRDGDVTRARLVLGVK